MLVFVSVVCRLYCCIFVLSDVGNVLMFGLMISSVVLYCLVSVLMIFIVGFLCKLLILVLNVRLRYVIIGLWNWFVVCCMCLIMKCGLLLFM